MATAPARIAEDVDVGRPHSESLVAGGIALLGAGELVVFRPRLGGNGAGDPVMEVRVPCGRQGDRLRENRRLASPRHAVERFVPPMVGGDAEPRNRRAIHHHLRGFFLQTETRNQIRHPFVKRAGWIPEQFGLRLRVRWDAQQQGNKGCGGFHGVLSVIWNSILIHCQLPENH